jgi:tRNA uridine 5-carboxymethylaminomethyl modification enzyme
MARLLEGLPRVRVVEGEVIGLIESDDGVRGVRLADGRRLAANAVLLTTGTFLSGQLHTGDETMPGGRFGEPPSVGLGGELARLGLELRRFKTGTPPRLHCDSIDYGRVEEQAGDPEPRAFSWRTRAVRNRARCWLTRTPEAVQNIIRDNLDRSPLFAGRISGVGPRYCPSIEDKVVRFPDHREHTVFLEPEGLDSESVYLNGLSTSLPRDVQEMVVRAVPGLERARFLRYGYAVEYDVVAPCQVKRTLACRSLPGLHLGGQLLGTSGYEEAAALGFLAGVNIARAALGRPPWVPGRDEGYLGVLVDDVCGGEHREPYRIFTSRAEHRLILGVDSARERLMARGARFGLVPKAAFHVEQRRWERRRRAGQALRESRLNPDRSTRDELRRIAGIDLRAPSSWAQVLRRQDVDAERLAASLPELAQLGPADRAVVVGLLRYDGYLARHRREVERLGRLRHLEIPEELDPRTIAGLSSEAIEELERSRPRTIADAERLSALTPAGLTALLAWVSAHHRSRNGCPPS